MNYKSRIPSEYSRCPVIYAESIRNMGGTGVYLRRLLKGFQIRGSRVLAAAGRKLMTPGDLLKSQPETGKLRKIVRENAILPARIKHFNPSIVHLPAFSGSSPEGVPCAVTVHDLAFLRNPSWFPFFKALYYRMHFRKVAERADVIMTDSDFTSDEIIGLMGMDPEKIRRVYLCTESFLSNESFFRVSYSISEDYIVFAGTIEPRKNLRNLLLSWPAVRKVYPGLKLVVAGRWGWGPKQLKRSLDESDGVIMTGSLPDSMLKSCISGASLLVYPSLYEGFGLPPLEAASAGVLSVLTPAGSMRELYSNVAVIAEGFDPNSICNAILEGLDTETDREKLQDFAKGFSIGGMADNVLEVYREFGS